jgi:hypothetical protein
MSGQALEGLASLESIRLAARNSRIFAHIGMRPSKVR